MSNHIVIYSVSRNYTRCRVAYGDRKTHIRVGTSTLALDKGLKRKERYDTIATWLKERFKLRMPDYLPTVSGS